MKLPILLLAIAIASPAHAAQFFVAPNGSDASPGTRERPFASPHRARDAARQVLARGEAAEVILRAGNYELSAPLELGEADSGKPNRPAVWRAADGTKVRLSAGRGVTNWRPVSDPQVLARLDPSVRGRVLQADLKASGISDLGTMGSEKNGLPGMELFLDDEPARISRYPNTGFISVAEVLGPTVIDHGGTKGTKEGVIKSADPRVARWVGEKDARVLGYWFFDWADQRQKITSLDAATLLFSLGGEHEFGYRKGGYFYGFNLLCEIDTPGEWYLDRETGIAYVLPFANRARARAMATVLPNAIKISGASHILLRNLVIEGARETAVVIDGSTGASLVGCTIRNSGSWAVRIAGGSTCSVRGSDITGTGDGGVSIDGGDRASLAAANHAVENCHIHHYSRWNRTYKPGVSLQGVGNRASRNLIHHAPHEAIEFGGNDHLIEGNEIHNVCEETNDAGAIYAGRNWTWRGHVIRNNFLHHIYGKDGGGANGVYLDDNFSSARIEGNIFEEQVRPIHIGGGRDNEVLNNLFVNCASALHIDARGLGWRSNGFDDLKQKLEVMPYKSAPWSARYPSLGKILDDEPMAPRGNLVARNISVGGSWNDIEGKALPFITLRDNLFDAPASLLGRAPSTSPSASPVAQSLGITNARANWISASTSNSSTRAPSTWAWAPPVPRRDASVQAIGFVPIPLDRIGLYASRERASWPVSHKVDVQQWPNNKAGGLVPHPLAPLRVARVAKIPIVDGAATPGEYGLRAVEVGETPGRGKIERAPARMRLAHDGASLYVAISIPIASAGSLVQKGGWGEADGVEVALRSMAGAGQVREPGQIFLVQGFADGRSQASRDAGTPEVLALALGKAARFASKIENGQWTAEWSLPLKAAGIEARTGTAIGFNVGVRRTATNEWLAWTGTGAQNWRLDGAGQLVLE